MKITPHIRWMIRRDMPEILAIDAAGFGPAAWGEEDYLRLLRNKNVIGMVAEPVAVDGWAYALGGMVYELHRDRLEVLRLAVHPDHRRRGVGRALLAKIEGKLSAHRRLRATLVVDDTRTGAHLWLRACGWRASGVLRADHPLERDRYRFGYRLAPIGPDPALPPIGEPPRFGDWSQRLARDLGSLVGSRPDLRPAVDHLMRLLGRLPAGLGPLPVPALTPAPPGHFDRGMIRLEWDQGARRLFLLAAPWGLNFHFSHTPARGVVPERGPQADQVAAALAWLHGLPAPPARYVFEEEDRS